MEHVTLQEIIRQHIVFPGKYNSTGWNSVLCQVCHDHGGKGNRGGFRFDGEAVAYNCFNCGHAAVFDPTKCDKIPAKMATVLNAFGIPESDWRVIDLQLLGKDISTTQTAPKLNIEPAEIQLPTYFYPIKDDSDEWNQIAIEYLRDRNINYKDYTFYMAKKTTHPDSNRWRGRLIIPIYKDRKLVFYQGRDLSDTQEHKYLSPNIPKGSVISGYEHIDKHTSSPLYITEGWFDAYHIDGCSIFGKKLFDIQIAWFKQTNRPKVVIPDRTGGGQALALQAANLGWGVSFPDIGEGNDDINEAIQRYGQLYVRKTIFDNIITDPEHIGMRVGEYCTNG